jgi:hypothetical protein
MFLISAAFCSAEFCRESGWGHVAMICVSAGGSSGVVGIEFVHQRRRRSDGLHTDGWYSSELRQKREVLTIEAPIFRHRRADADGE